MNALSMASLNNTIIGTEPKFLGFLLGTFLVVQPLLLSSLAGKEIKHQMCECMIDITYILNQYNTLLQMKHARLSAVITVSERHNGQ
jgi:hypothetical protein